MEVQEVTVEVQEESLAVKFFSMCHRCMGLTTILHALGKYSRMHSKSSAPLSNHQFIPDNNFGPQVLNTLLLFDYSHNSSSAHFKLI